jgi:hypothetical protein
MKTREELAEELAMRCKLDEERKVSDERYAWQRDFALIQKIVYALIGLITTGAVLSFIRTIWK